MSFSRKDVDLMLEKQEITSFYKNINTLWSIMGPQALLSVWPWVLTRGENIGITYSEFMEVSSKAKTFDSRGKGDDWLNAWMDAGDAWQARAQEYENQGNRTIAAEIYLRASSSYFMGIHCIFTDSTLPYREDRVEAIRRCVDAYRKAAPLMTPPAERIEIPYEDIVLPGYVRTPLGAPRSPCVIMIGGANSFKEEIHFASETLMRNGLTTVCVDLPGQGEVWPKRTMKIDEVPAMVSRVIDYLSKNTQVDSDRIGIWGLSTGGFLVAYAAGFDDRIKASVSHCTSYDWDPYYDDNFPLISQIEVACFFGSPTLKESRETIKQVSLKGGILNKIACPMLLVHGKQDVLIPYTDAQKIVEERKRSGRETEARIFEEGQTHTTNMVRISVSAAAEWLLQKLV